MNKNLYTVVDKDSEVVPGMKDVSVKVIADKLNVSASYVAKCSIDGKTIHEIYNVYKTGELKCLANLGDWKTNFYSQWSEVTSELKKHFKQTESVNQC